VLGAATRGDQLGEVVVVAVRRGERVVRPDGDEVGGEHGPHRRPCSFALLHAAARGDDGVQLIRAALDVMADRPSGEAP
jgi:hypothetical protein